MCKPTSISYSNSYFKANWSDNIDNTLNMLKMQQEIKTRTRAALEPDPAACA